MKKILLVTFSDNADHQDITFGMYEQFKDNANVYLMCIKTPKASLSKTERCWLVDCPKRPGITKKTFDIILLNKIIRRINKERFDAIFFETLHIWNLAIMLRCHGNTKMYQVIHDVIPHEGDKAAKSVNLMNKAVCKLADYIVLVNKKYINYLHDTYSVDLKRIKSLDMWRRFGTYTKPTYSKKVLFFGRINPYKGADNLLKLVEMCPEINFVVTGSVDPQVKDTVDNIQKHKNVKTTLGYVSDQQMENAFINCDWVIVPYNSATQSGVVIDAYRYGRPVIAFNVGAISEQVDEGVSGYLIEPGNIDAFADCLKKAVQKSDKELDQLSRSAYKYGVNKYAAEGAVDRFLKLFE